MATLSRDILRHRERTPYQSPVQSPASPQEHEDDDEKQQQPLPSLEELPHSPGQSLPQRQTAELTLTPAISARRNEPRSIGAVPADVVSVEARTSHHGDDNEFVLKETVRHRVLRWYMDRSAHIEELREALQAFDIGLYAATSNTTYKPMLKHYYKKRQIDRILEELNNPTSSLTERDARIQVFTISDFDTEIARNLLNAWNTACKNNKPLWVYEDSGSLSAQRTDTLLTLPDRSRPR